MPQFESEPILSLVYKAASGDNTYSYSGLTLISALTDASQIEVRWDVDTVYSAINNSGTSFSVEDLPNSVQEEIKTLIFDTHFTINSEEDKITVIPGAIQNTSVTTIDGNTYFYPQTMSINSSEFLSIRRSTDITSRVVEFQPGARLTAENLNLSNAQIFNALQELTEFGYGGTGGTIADLDLSNNSIDDLGDVTINASLTGILQYDSVTGFVTNVDTIGGLVPGESGVTTDGKALISSFVFGGINSTPSYDWQWVTFDEVKNNKAGASSLQDELDDVSARFVPIENKLTDITRPDSTATVVNNDLTLPLDNIIVTAGDVLVQSLSTYDAIKPYIYLHNNLSFTSTNITGAGEKNWFLGTDWNGGVASYTGSTEALSGLNTTTGTYTAARDQVIKIDVSFRSTGSSLPYGVNTNISFTPSGASAANVGPTWVNREVDGSSGRAHSGGTWILDMSAGDSFTVLSSRIDSGNTQVIAGTLSIVEIR